MFSDNSQGGRHTTVVARSRNFATGVHTVHAPAIRAPAAGALAMRGLATPAAHANARHCRRKPAR
jgi:hypothetical protein